LPSSLVEQASLAVSLATLYVLRLEFIYALPGLVA